MISLGRGDFAAFTQNLSLLKASFEETLGKRLPSEGAAQGWPGTLRAGGRSA